MNKIVFEMGFGFRGADIFSSPHKELRPCDKSSFLLLVKRPRPFGCNHVVYFVIISFARSFLFLSLATYLVLLQTQYFLKKLSVFDQFTAIAPHKQHIYILLYLTRDRVN